MSIENVIAENPHMCQTWAMNAKTAPAPFYSIGKFHRTGKFQHTGTFTVLGALTRLPQYIII